jgi:hypothetical protein
MQGNHKRFIGLNKFLDRLLQYLHQARNEDEHGIEPLATHITGAPIISGRSIQINNLRLIDGIIKNAHISSPKGDGIAIKSIPPHARLLQIISKRDGNTYNPPIEHLGNPLTNNTPLECATHPLAYYTQYIEYASKLITS